MSCSSVFEPVAKLNERESTLLRAAEEASNNAYSPYSRIKVGAALITSSGSVYKGANVENVSLGLTLCAERTAAAAAAAAGETDFLLLAVVCPDVKDLAPCGSCLQFLSEFCKDLTILTKPASGKVFKARLTQLLPARFYLKR